MLISDHLSFWGNVISFLAAVAKTVYDLYVNPRRFRKEEITLGLLKAAERKRARADASTAWTFLIVSIGYAFSIAALVKLL
jgi:hypothetical protein